MLEGNSMEATDSAAAFNFPDSNVLRTVYTVRHGV